MAIKIIEHKHERKKIRYAVKFLCKCGCVFWADDEDMKIPKEFDWTEYSPVKQAICPECNTEVSSCLSAVPREKIFGD